jgi:anti-anti-sigma factor
MHSLGEDVRIEPSADGGTTVRFRVPLRPRGSEGPDQASLGAAVRPAGSDTSAWLTRGTAPDGGIVLALSGELDLSSADALRAELLEAISTLDGSPSAPTVDLRGTTYLASAGVGLLLQAAAAASTADRSLRVVVRPGSAPARLLQVGGLDGALAISAVEQRDD